MLSSCTLVLTLIVTSAPAVQLENWRLPYYTLVEHLGLFTSSPSGMFWDDLEQPTSKTLFDSLLWPDSAKNSRNHWTLEPAASIGAGNEEQFLGKNAFFHFTALNDIRYGGFLARQVLDVDSRYFDDPGFIGLKQRVAAGKISEAYLQYNFKYGFLRFGRLNRNWGPFIDHSLFLSANPYSYDALEFCLTSPWFEFRHIFAAFSDNGLTMDLDTTGAHRYFTAHALNLILGKLGTIGVFESVVFSNYGGFPEFQYINPVTIYSANHTNGEAEGNLMVGFQGNLHPFTKNLSLKGQLLIDDIQIDNNGPGDQKPNTWGTDVAATWNHCLPIPLPHGLTLEYRYISRWLYTISDDHSAEGQRYTYLGNGLGFPTNDGDNFNLYFTLAGRKYWAMESGISFNRQGQGTVLTRWNDESDSSKALGIVPNTLGYRTEPKFPSGIVESTSDIYITLFGQIRNILDLQFALHNRWVLHKDNIEAPLKYDPLVSISIGVHYSDLFVTLPK